MVGSCWDHGVGVGSWGRGGIIGWRWDHGEVTVGSWGGGGIMVGSWWDHGGVMVGLGGGEGIMGSGCEQDGMWEG